MDIRRVLSFLLLTICAVIAIRNNHGSLHNIRRIRRISLSEYLVPPPPPKFYPGRIPRTVPSSTAEPGYFNRFMDWLNPFKYDSPSPPPPTIPYEIPYTPTPEFIQPPPPPPADYDKPPLPLSSNSGYNSPIKTKNCNPCNTVPWTPIQGDDVSHSGDASYASSTLQVLPTNDYLSSVNGIYPPPSNPEASYDAQHAASQEIRAPDYTFASTMNTNGQDLTGLPSDPRLYLGAMPPLYKAQDFHSPQPSIPSIFKEISEYLYVPLPARNGSYLNIPDSLLNNYPVYPIYLSPTSSGSTNPGSINQELVYNNPSTSNGGLGQFGVQDHNAHTDLSSTQATHANSISDNQGLENIASQGSLYQQILGSPNVLLPSKVPNNGEPYDVTGSLGDLLDNSSQNLPTSYGISGPDQVPNNFENQYNDLSSSDDVAKDTYAPPNSPAESSTKIENSIHFEKSPLLDFTYKGESRTKSSSIPPTSNAIAEIAESAESTLAPGEEVFGTRQGVASTTYFQTIDPSVFLPESESNNSLTRNLNRSVYNSKFMKQNISYTPSTVQTTVPQSVPTTIMTTTTTTPKSILSQIFFWPFSWNNDENSTDNTREEENYKNANVNSDKPSAKQQDVKKTKQVQVIIPYTQQHTPLPFYTQKVPQTVSNFDNYVAEGSSNAIKVTSLPGSSNTYQTLPTTSEIPKNHTRKPAGTNANNSIDVHKLQKNIDNWIIQKYSKSTTASTELPSSANPYLFPSKKIPHEYLTTTESLTEHIASPHKNINAKTFTLGGFTFNDVDYKASSSNRVEQTSQVQVGQNSSANDVPVVSPKEDTAWQNFFVDISRKNKERVYVVTPQSVVTTFKSSPVEQRKEKAIKEAEGDPKESSQRQVPETDTKKSTADSNAFEKAYQVLPQAVNNLAVASTGPESVPLWGIMEHEEFASLDDNEHETDEADESSESPLLYSGHSKVSRARR